MPGDVPAPFIDVPEPPIPAPASTADPSIARALKRRQKKSSAVWLIPVVLGLVLVSIAGYYLWEEQPTLQGELEAVRLDDDFAPPPGGIKPDAAGDLSDGAYAAAVERLEDYPKRLTGKLMVTEFRAGRGKVAVLIEAGREGRFFRVNPRSSRDFKRFVDANVQRLQEPWRNEYERAVLRFVSEFQETGGDFDAGPYVYSVAVNAMARSAGYNMVAVVGNKAYRCVYEDGKGRLYFLLPKGTRRFELTGRKLDDGRTLIPDCRYDVNVK